jgi:hypothetical protein
MSVLCIGLTLESFECLSSQIDEDTRAAVSVKEATETLSKSEYSRIILDPTELSSPADVLTTLLSHTPLTTSIILLCDDLDDLALTQEELAEMGVHWVRSAEEAQERLGASTP